MKIEANVAKDRIPLRQSFNHCTFGKLLKSSKEFDETSDIGSFKDAESSRETEDIVMMKRKFLSDDRFLKRGAKTVPGKESNPNSDSMSINVSKGDMLKPDIDLKDYSEIALEENSELGYDKELSKDLQIDSDDKENEISSGRRRNIKVEEADLGEYRSKERTEDISNVKSNNTGTGSGESNNLMALNDLAEGNSNKDLNAENCSEAINAGTESS